MLLTSDTNSDCAQTEGFECNRRDERDLCSCTGKATDICRKIGACRETACAACNRCINDMQGFVDQYSTIESPTMLASRFYEYCLAGGKRTAPVCNAARMSIGNSFRGNQGRRAAGICSALKECDANSLGFMCRWVTLQGMQKVHLLHTLQELQHVHSLYTPIDCLVHRSLGAQHLKEVCSVQQSHGVAS